jgi:hypothetical protein
MAGISFECFIDQQDYLLKHQKDALKQAYLEADISALASAWDILDAILFKLFSMSKDDLTPAEKMAIDQILKEYNYG